MKGLVLRSLIRKFDDMEIQADFTVGEGECVGILGRSGLGKTTLLRMIAGLTPTDRGQVLLDGGDLTRLSVQARRIGYVTQEPALFPALTVLENAAFGLRMAGVKRAEREGLAMEWLGRVGLAPKARSDVTHLSGGEKQRLALVRAMIWKPKLVLLDEPFTALDSGVRRSLQALVRELRTETSAPTILVTHDEADLEALATRRIIGQESGEIRRFQN